MGHIDVTAKSVRNSEVAYVLIAQARVECEPPGYFVIVLNVAVTRLVTPVAREVPEALQRLVDVAKSRSSDIRLPEQEVRPGERNHISLEDEFGHVIAAVGVGSAEGDLVLALGPRQSVGDVVFVLSEIRRRSSTGREAIVSDIDKRVCVLLSRNRHTQAREGESVVVRHLEGRPMETNQKLVHHVGSQY